jgi:hypothetical protein
MNLRSVRPQSHRLMVGYTPFVIVHPISAPDTDSPGLAGLEPLYGCYERKPLDPAGAEQSENNLDETST